ncbi:MAG: yjjL [Gammaproteobacteria bacterium]|jgi:sugar phosphate permease|nr:yjjL [Gammaproteobacteria bacterium]
MEKMEAIIDNSMIQQRSRPWVWFFPILVCSLGAAFYAYEYLLRITPNVIYADLLRYFGISATGYGFINAFYYYAYTPMQLPVGMLMDRYGPRRLLTLACLACALGTYIFASTTRWEVALFARFLVGFGSAFAFVGVLKLATIWLPSNKFGLVAGMASSFGTLVGAFLGELVLEHLVNILHWRPTLFISAFAGVILAVTMVLVIRDKPKDSSRNYSSDALEQQPKTMAEVIKHSLVLLKNKFIWLNGLIGCLLYLPASGFAENWEKPYLMVAHGFTSQQAANAVSAVFLGFTLGGILFGYVSDKICRRKMPMVIGGILAAILISIVLYVPGLPTTLIFILLFLFGVAYGAEVLVFPIGRELSSKKVSATAVAVTNMLVMVSGSLLTPLVGIILDHLWNGNILNNERIYTASNFTVALTMLPIACIVGAFLAAFLRETYGKPLEE